MGKTIAAWSLIVRRQEHPHIRGEDPSANAFNHFVKGTSPHAWGRPPRAFDADSYRRNIPTYVGKTDVLDRLEKQTQEHPHIRGEDSNAAPTSYPDSGTSPHTWGRPSRKSSDFMVLRNIPTYVGKTHGVLDDRGCAQEHPHIRGEDSRRWRLLPIGEGTSPHTWGRPLCTYLFDQIDRNIPTYVGKTLKMLSKIKYLTFSKVPNLVTFNDFKSQPERSNCSQATKQLLKSSNSLFTCQRTLFQTYLGTTTL